MPCLRFRIIAGSLDLTPWTCFVIQFLSIAANRIRNTRERIQRRMFKFIHTADIHLDSPLHRLESYEGAPVEEIRQATRRAFENLIETALGESVDFLLIAGDLFDGDWRDYNTGLFFVSQMQRLKTAGIRVYIVSGNHDAAGRMTRSLPFPENVHVFSPRQPGTQKHERTGVAIHGQSFANAAVMDNLARHYPEPVPGYFNIGLLHTSLNGREGHENYAPCSLEDLQNRGYDYWALGHVHQFEMVASDPPTVFPGCIQGRNIRETGVKGSVLVVVDENRTPEITPCPHAVIRWARLEVDLNHAATREAALDAFKDTLATLLDRSASWPFIVRATFNGQTPAHAAIVGDLDYWKEAVRSIAVANYGERVWVEKIIVGTSAPPKSEAAAVDPGPLRELDHLVADLQRDEKQLRAVAEALSPLLQRMPADYRQGENALNPDDTDHLRQIVGQAYALLVKGLKQENSGA